MYPVLKCINPNGLEGAIEKFACDNFERVYITSEHLEVPFFITKPTGKWTAPNKFPDCCPFHRSVFVEALSLLQRFPNCCAGHKKLKGKEWFNKNDYKGLPIKLLNTLSHTEYHILNQIEKPNWYQDITDYIEYCVISFGQFPRGYGSPLGLNLYLANVKNVLETREFVPKDKRGKLLAFLDGIPNEQTEINLNTLFETYSKWLNTFPFHLSIFSHLKERFKKQVPILKEEFRENPYTGFSKAALKSKDELITFLIETTENILLEINALKLYEQGKLSIINKLNLEIVVEGRRMELSAMKKDIIDERGEYSKVIKNWLIGEESFLHKLVPLLSTDERKLETLECETKSAKLERFLKEFGFFQLQKVSILSEDGKSALINLLQANKLPFQIALLDFLGFFEYLIGNHFKAKYRMFKEVSKWLGSDKDGRAVKANIASLSANSTEDKDRYTAYKHKEKVKKAYQNIK